MRLFLLGQRPESLVSRPLSWLERPNSQSLSVNGDSPVNRIGCRREHCPPMRSESLRVVPFWRQLQVPRYLRREIRRSAIQLCECCLINEIARPICQQLSASRLVTKEMQRFRPHRSKTKPASLARKTGTILLTNQGQLLILPLIPPRVPG